MSDIGQKIEGAAATVGAERQDFLSEVGNLLQAGVSTIATAQQLFALAQSVTVKGNPEQSDWDQLHAILDANTAALNAPLPD